MMKILSKCLWVLVGVLVGVLTIARVEGQVVPTGGGGGGSSTITSFPDNEPFNVAQINGVAPSMGAGVNGTGVLRVNEATDSQLSANINTLVSNLATDCAQDAASCSNAPAVMLEYKVLDGALVNTVGTESDAVRWAGTAGGVAFTTLVDTLGTGSAIGLEDVASAAGEAGVKIWAIRDDTLDARSATEGDLEYFHTNANGALWVIDVNSAAALTALQLLDDAVFSDDAAFTPATSKGFAVGFQADDTTPDSVDEGDFGVPRMSLDRMLYMRPGGASVHYRTSVGTTEDEHEIKATAGTLYSVLITNTNAAARYIRCYDLTAASTTPGTSTVFWGAAIPGATAGAGFTYSFPSGLTFATALTCAWTTGAADTDVAEVAANEIKATYTFR